MRRFNMLAGIIGVLFLSSGCSATASPAPTPTYSVAPPHARAGDAATRDRKPAARGCRPRNNTGSGSPQRQGDGSNTTWSIRSSGLSPPVRALPPLQAHRGPSRVVPNHPLPRAVVDGQKPSRSDRSKPCSVEH